jgi:hypothetical protein
MTDGTIGYSTSSDGLANSSLISIEMSNSPDNARLASNYALQRPAHISFKSSDKGQSNGHVTVMPTSDDSIENAARSLQQFSVPRVEGQGAKPLTSSNSNQAGIEEEAVVYSQTRMLIDPTGRLCMRNLQLSSPLLTDGKYMSEMLQRYHSFN